MPAPFSNSESWHASILSSLSEPVTHLYSYKHVMKGFSAVLTTTQFERVKQVPGHVASYPDSYGQLLTTHTPKFLSLMTGSGLWPASNYGSGMIIGILDTGIWPESQSFNDDGMPPVPKTWKGRCETGTKFNSSLCNRKLIGARSFSKGHKQHGNKVPKSIDYDSPRDFHGHGTHTSSTAAGRPVAGVSYFGYAQGVATGMAPKAHIAMYKVVFAGDTIQSAGADILAGMDQAIEDGVDLISLSLGLDVAPYYRDIIAMGAFAAMEKGIFVACAAGNRGPETSSIINGAPWLTSVGAGTIDRKFVATVSLGNGSETIRGLSTYPKRLFLSKISLYYGSENTTRTESCDSLHLNPKKVAGKIVFCTLASEIGIYYQMIKLSQLSAKGAIFATNLGEFILPESYYIPFVAVSLSTRKVIKNYIAGANKTAAVSISFGETKLGTKPAPQVAFFSSRGPSQISPSILKPDILAPGVDVLAAWVPNRVFAQAGNHNLYTDYALVSGTSMASPHVIGIAAMIKSVHGDWSSAAIRSAMMTTADTTDNTGNWIIDMSSDTAGSPLAYGAGHVNPNKAMDPGLVYDITVQDYIDFLCGLNYTKSQISMITRRSNCRCTKANLDLNYPSFTVILNNANMTTFKFKRVLTNMESTTTRYQAAVRASKGMKVLVKPQMLNFNGLNSKQEFSVRMDIDMSKSARNQSEYLGNYGYLSWYEIGGKHVVTSPIVSTFAPSHKDYTI